jgi:superfamily II DNA/RNA helicase
MSISPELPCQNCLLPVLNPKVGQISPMTAVMVHLRSKVMIKQNVEVVSYCDKYPSLVHHLRREFNDGSKVMVFMETKKGCDQLTLSLCFQGYPVVKLLCICEYCDLLAHFYFQAN